MAKKREIYSRKFLFPILRAALQLLCQGVHWQSTLISDDRPFSSIKNQLQVNLFLVYLQCRTDSVKKKLKEDRLHCRRCNGLKGSSFKDLYGKKTESKKYLQRNIYITSVVKWTCSCFGLQHKPSTEANDMLFKICNPDSADDERRFFFGMSKYVGQLHVHYSTGVDLPTQCKRRDLQPSVMDSERVHM